MGVRRPVDVRVTRTPLGGSPDAAIVEEVGLGVGTVRRVGVRLSQTVGSQEGDIVVANPGGARNAWASGDGLKVEARRFGDATWTTLLDGYLGAPAYEPGVVHPSLSAPLRGWTTLLDMVHTSTDLEYLDTAYTTIADDLVTQVLGAGFSRSITTDAATATRLVIPAGVTLRQALDMVRAGLNTGTTRWEHLVEIVSGAKQYRLYKRSTTPQATFEAVDLLPGSTRVKPDVAEVINDVRILGDVVPHAVTDKTGTTKVGTTRLDATGDQVAQPFTATTTPLYGVSFQADRSRTTDPPTLRGWVQRNSDNKDRLGASLVQGTSLRLRSGSLSSPDNAHDANNATSAQTTYTDDDTYRELLAFDLGASPETVRAVLFRSNAVAGHTLQWRSHTSDNFAAATVRDTYTAGSGGVQFTYLSDVTARYWFLAGKKTAGIGALNIEEVKLLRYQNAATDPTGPKNVHDEDTATSATVATTGAQTKEVARFDFASAQPYAKVAVRHSESSAPSDLTLLVQSSDNGSTWTTLALMTATTSPVLDTSVLEPLSKRYFRVVVQDDRSGGSASITTTVTQVELYWHKTTIAEGDRPLLADQVKGSLVTWAAENLVPTPGIIEERTYPTPRLALVTGAGYWLVFKGDTGVSTSSWWELDHGTESGVIDALTSTDSGTTWASIATDAVLLHMLRFNNAELVGTAADATSKTTYASFVPGGVLAASVKSPVLQTQDAVDKEAASLLARRKNGAERYVLVVPFDPTLVPGQPVTLTLEAAQVLGLAAETDVDVVEVRHDVEPGVQVDGAVSRLVCGEHFPSMESMTAELAALASQRRI